ncbi:MAG: diaminopimelate decarboxylase [Planctomycetes bacterium]|nr:diaminopimelate decarboxylase [Planctomycetota bacterium]
MDFFRYEDGALKVEGVAVSELAERYGTPLYVYSAGTLEHHVEQLRTAFARHEPVICYSVKACSNVHILERMAGLGVGFDVVSGGELYRIVKAGLPTENVVYAGVGKTEVEIRFAIDNGILMFNVESEPELREIDRVARGMGKKARIAMRVNPNVDAHTHAYTTTGKHENKFGLTIEKARAVSGKIASMDGVSLAGLHAHIGSQITSPEPYATALERVVDLMLEIRSESLPLEYLNMGGGFGANYESTEQALQPTEFAKATGPAVERSGARLMMEPGRYVVANAAILVSRLLYDKEGEGKHFYIVDAGMNDLIRPSLYEAYQGIWPVKSETEPPFRGGREAPGGVLCDVVGPICESGDFLGRDRKLPAMGEGDLLAVYGAGAYGMAMASNYNSRPRPAEVLVDGSSHRLIRRRETWEDLVRLENEV